MSQSAALIAARASSGAAASCSGRAHPRHVTAPRAHLSSLPQPSHSLAHTAAGRKHALRVAAAGDGTAMSQPAAPGLLRSRCQPLTPQQRHRSDFAPLRARGRYEEDEEDDDDEEEDPLEDDLVPGPRLPHASVASELQHLHGDQLQQNWYTSLTVISNDSGVYRMDISSGLLTGGVRAGLARRRLLVGPCRRGALFWGINWW